MLIYDPINLERIPINDYLDNDSNNIVIIYNNKAYGVNKSLFMFNNEMKRCIIANNALLKNKTYNNPETFYNIGYFIGKKIIVNLDTLNNILKEHRIIELTSKTTGNTYINKELLELTTIGLIKLSSKKSIKKANFKYVYEDVYFDELMSLILKQYTLKMYRYINKILLNPKLYDNNEPLKNGFVELLKFDKVFDVSKSKDFKNIDFKKAMDNMITKIDKGFIEVAPRYEKTYIRKVFYRGMTEKYINTNGEELENIGDTALITTYISISSDYATAKQFALGANAVIYKIYLDEGLPFINMVSNTLFKNEKEYLLPRNIIFELISKKGNEYTVLAKPFKPDQFSIKTGCFSLDYYDIIPSKISLSSLSKSKSKSKPKPIDLIKSKNDIIPVKLKKCPKGMMRDKITKECVPKKNMVNTKIKPKSLKSPQPNVKLGRCPNGTKRNPKTLLCEAK